jgi:carbamoyltransferase
MKIIGLNHGEIDSSAALVVGGKVVAACSEERFNRQKKSRAFPQQALQFCLRTGRLELQGCDAVAQAWNPGESWLKYNPLISAHRIRREDNFYSIPDHLFSFSGRRPLDWSAMDFPAGAGVPRIYHITHHRAHAANAFFLSPFDEAAILTCDWRGEFESTTWCVGRGNRISVLDRLSVPHSLGMFYATFTELLGYRPDNDEWKVMALSAFDVDCRRAYRKLKGTYTLLDNGHFELDQSYYKGALLDQPRLYTKKLQDLLGGRCGKPGEDITEWHCVVAKAMQQAAEDIATHALRYLHKATGSRNLAVSGGFFMNSVFNGKVLDNTPFQRFYVSYAPGDLGNSVGAALYAAHCIHHERRRESPRLSYLGPEYSAADIEQCLERRRLRYERCRSIERDIARLLAEGQIVAVFQGRMEFGERALGNRSILADPRREDIKDRINASIKYRESYRPFAPSVLLEEAHHYFDVPKGFDAPYMERVVPVRPRFRKVLPAITHVDGSGRIHTVRKEHNPRYYRIIDQFRKITGFPVVLNTSFNINGEPIVASPDDALNTFFNSGIEYLALGDFLLSKTP